MNKHKEYSDNKIYPEISSLKGLAIIAIILCHIGQTFGNINEVIYYSFSIGQMASQLFFMTSALLLSFSYTANKQTYGTFVLKRYKRLAPAYWIAIIISIIFCYAGPLIKYSGYYHIKENPINIVINVLLLNGLFKSGNNNVVFGGWFVGTLIIFYLFFPLLFKMHCHIKRKIKNNYILLLILITVQICFAIIFRIFNISCEPLSYTYYSAINQLTSFLTGFVVFELYQENKIKFIKIPLVKFIILFAIAILEYAGGFFVKWHDTFIFAPLLFSYSYIYLFIFFHQLFQKGKITNSNFSKGTIFLGNHSYGIYLLNLYIIYPFCPLLCSYLLNRLNIELLPCLIIVILIFVPLCCLIGSLYDKLFNRKNYLEYITQ